MKKGWLPTRLNCIVDAPAHRISMRLFLTIAVLLVSKRKASALLAHTHTRASLFPRPGKFGTDEPPSLSCHGTISESVIPNRNADDAPRIPSPQPFPRHLATRQVGISIVKVSRIIREEEKDVSILLSRMIVNFNFNIDPIVRDAKASNSSFLHKIFFSSSSSFSFSSSSSSSHRLIFFLIAAIVTDFGLA